MAADALSVERAELHYGAAIALRGVSLTANRGEVTCLIGRNGVGKTSTLRAIIGAHPLSAGRIVWEGEDVTRLPMYERARRGIAWVPQGRDISRCSLCAKTWRPGSQSCRGGNGKFQTRFSRCSRS